MARGSTTHGAQQRGFTLIELLIVIGILGVLAAALLPQVLGAREQGEIADTTVRIQFLAEAAKKFERKNGFYPPDDFIDPKGKLKSKADATNSGIESLVIFVCQKRVGTDSLADNEDWLENTDADDNGGVIIPLLERSKKMEVVDAWGLPLAYFCSMNDGYSRKQTVMTAAGDNVRADAMRNGRTGKYAAPGKFQIISAGPDGEFGNSDDVCYPVRIEE